MNSPIEALRLPVALACLTASVSALAVVQEPATLEVEEPAAAAELEPTASEALGALLTERGFVALEVERMLTSHLLLHVSINGSEPRRFVCDTGAGATLIFPELAEELGLTSESSGERAGGVGGGGLELETVEIESLQIGEAAFSDRELMVMDLSDINWQFEASGEEPVEGIIGAPWLIEHEAVIDMAGDRLYARP